MKVSTALLSVFLFIGLPVATLSQATGQISDYKDEARQIIQASLDDDEGWKRLTHFVDKFGARITGSESLENSIDWIVQKMKQDEELDNIRTQRVMVDYWVRGDESAWLLEPRKEKLNMLGLGGSIGTPEGGITAEVLVVNSFEELHKKGEQAEGKIVVYNVPFTTYGETNDYRYRGAIEAAKEGAVASLIRSVASYSMNSPHTGASSYAKGVEKIPQAAITVEDAMMLDRMQSRGINPVIELKMDAKTMPEKVPSHNIIAEIEGSKYPEQIVVIGGHIDSWDVGQGAMDDAGGIFAAWQALRVIEQLGLQPKRTIRLVMWTDEESGITGGKAYKEMVQENGNLDNHILAIESDSGVFDPIGFGFTGSDEAYALIKKIGKLLAPVEASKIRRGGGGADISPLMQEGVPGMGLWVDGTRYFWYHHTEADTIDKLNKKDFNECVAAMAVMAFVTADMEQTLSQ